MDLPVILVHKHYLKSFVIALIVLLNAIQYQQMLLNVKIICMVFNQRTAI